MKIRTASNHPISRKVSDSETEEKADSVSSRRVLLSCPFSQYRSQASHRRSYSPICIRLKSLKLQNNSIEIVVSGRIKDVQADTSGHAQGAPVGQTCRPAGGARVSCQAAGRLG